jgi:hypothetical protein
MDKRWFGKTIMALASGAMLLALNSPCLASPITATRTTLTTADSHTNAPQRFYRLVLSP